MIFDFLKKKRPGGMPNVDLGKYIPPMPRLEYRAAMVVYLCDRKACDGTCPNPECNHTNDITHAKNFNSFVVSHNDGTKQKYYEEVQ